jgi:hypothetical protein
VGAVGAVGDGSRSVCTGKTAVVTGSVSNMVTYRRIQDDDSKMKQYLMSVYKRKKKKGEKEPWRRGSTEPCDPWTYLLTLSEGLICRFTKGYMCMCIDIVL